MFAPILQPKVELVGFFDRNPSRSLSLAFVDARKKKNNIKDHLSYKNNTNEMARHLKTEEITLLIIN